MLAPRNGKIDHVAQKCGIRAVDLPPLEQGVVSRLGAKTQFVALSEQPEITIQEYALILDHRRSRSRDYRRRGLFANLCLKGRRIRRRDQSDEDGHGRLYDQLQTSQ